MWVLHPTELRFERIVRRDLRFIVLKYRKNHKKEFNSMQFLLEWLSGRDIELRPPARAPSAEPLSHSQTKPITVHHGLRRKHKNDASKKHHVIA